MPSLLTNPAWFAALLLGALALAAPAPEQRQLTDPAPYSADAIASESVVARSETSSDPTSSAVADEQPADTWQAAGLPPDTVVVGADEDMPAAVFIGTLPEDQGPVDVLSQESNEGQDADRAEGSPEHGSVAGSRQAGPGPEPTMMIPRGAESGHELFEEFDCSKCATYCTMETWLGDLPEAAAAAIEESAPEIEFEWYSVTPKRTGNRSLETAVNVPLWFAIDEGYERVTADEAETHDLTWQPLGPIAWCLGDGGRAAYSLDDGYAFEVAIDKLREIDTTLPISELPLPSFEYSSLGQPRRRSTGPHANESAFTTHAIASWKVTGIVEGSSVDVVLATCGSQPIWVRQIQSILVDPSAGVPDWLKELR